MITAIVFLSQLLASYISISYIYNSVDLTNYQYARNQRYIWALIYLFFGSFPWLVYLVNGSTNLTIAGSITVSLSGLFISSWNRETKIKSVPHREFEFQKYRFILPIGSYRGMNLQEWIEFITDSQTYMVEIHMRPKEDRKEHKFCFKVENGTPTDDIKTDPRVLHGCRLCDNAESDFVQIKYCWNNPSEHVINDSDVCQNCYIQLMNEVEKEITEFESPKGEFLAANL